jgi:hypothetical protein
VKGFTTDLVVWYDEPHFMTYSSMVARVQPDGGAFVYVKIANPGEHPYEISGPVRDVLTGRSIPTSP